jgi:hypothetical protein
MDVVDVAVAIVVDAIDGVEGVDPDVPGEILMLAHHAFVDDADVDVV